jgi:cytochrome c peroxidase
MDALPTEAVCGCLFFGGGVLVSRTIRGRERAKAGVPGMAGEESFCFGGVFWDGRAEGRASPLVASPSVTGLGATPHVGEEIFSTTGQGNAYRKFIGPVADQALGPFPNDVEQNVPDGNDGGLPGAEAVCRHVESAKYAELFERSWDEEIDCGINKVGISFKRIALAIAAWQHSDEVNSFSSKRDAGLKKSGLQDCTRGNDSRPRA